MKRILPLILCLCMLLSCFAGCAAEDTPYVPHGDALMDEDTDVNKPIVQDKGPQELTMVCYLDRPMNPYVSNDYTNRTLFSLIYQGLFAVSPDYEAVPILCDQYRVSSTYKIYTFYVDDATFSDGTPVTIEDVAASYESDVGIVPCPKYDENQTEYYSRAGFNGATCITILTSTPDLDRAGMLLEVFSAESKNYISPAFYEKLFTDRYTNDDESKEMLSIVIESEIIDLDQVFKWGDLIVAASSAASRGTGNPSTLYKRLMTMAQTKLESTIDTYLTPAN